MTGTTVNPNILDGAFSRAPLTLVQYSAKHPERLRDLAEVVVIATTGAFEAHHLTDPDDSRSAVFDECVKLYAQAHNISDEQLSAAVYDWQHIAAA